MTHGRIWDTGEEERGMGGQQTYGPDSWQARGHRIAELEAALAASEQRVKDWERHWVVSSSRATELEAQFQASEQRVRELEEIRNAYMRDLLGTEDRLERAMSVVRAYLGREPKAFAHIDIQAREFLDALASGSPQEGTS